jgi:subtilisin
MPLVLGVLIVSIAFGPVFSHGTAVAGYAAAKDNGFGVVGATPGANIWSARVVNKQGKIPTSNLICAVDWVTATRTDGDPRNDIAVANVSISGRLGPPRP